MATRVTQRDPACSGDRPSRPSSVDLRAPRDPERERLERLLHDLRPDVPDYLEPPQEAPALAPYTPQIRDPSAAWGGIPSGYGQRVEAAEPPRVAVQVLASLDELAPDARAVLRWVRDHGSLRDGARGLFTAAGLHFAGDLQALAWGLREPREGEAAPSVGSVLGARREGAYLHGRHLVLAAATAWGR